MSKKCSGKVETYSRVVGFYRPTSLWNRGKKEEFKERVPYLINFKKQS